MGTERTKRGIYRFSTKKQSTSCVTYLGRESRLWNYVLSNLGDIYNRLCEREKEGRINLVIVILIILIIATSKQERGLIGGEEGEELGEGQGEEGTEHGEMERWKRWRRQEKRGGGRR